MPWRLCVPAAQPRRQTPRCPQQRDQEAITCNSWWHVTVPQVQSVWMLWQDVEQHRAVKSDGHKCRARGPEKGAAVGLRTYSSTTNFGLLLLCVLISWAGKWCRKWPFLNVSVITGLTDSTDWADCPQSLAQQSVIMGNGTHNWLTDHKSTLHATEKRA